tara:strand:- start:1851 stop:2123 length:273 start_codon:yes stop_codon:yes gene_type:complete
MKGFKEVKDNPMWKYLSPEHLTQALLLGLVTMTPEERERYLYGHWEASEEPPTKGGDKGRTPRREVAIPTDISGDGFITLEKARERRGGR